MNLPQQFFFAAFIILLFLAADASASTVPELGISTSFLSLKQTSSIGVSSIASKAALTLAPNVRWISDQTGAQFNLGAKVQWLDFGSLSTSLGIQQNPNYLFGLNSGAYIYLRSFTLGLGVQYGQQLLLDSVNNPNLVLDKVLEPAGSLEIAYKVLADRKGTVRFGFDGTYYLASTNAGGLATHEGVGEKFYINIEFHKKTKLEIIVFYENRDVNTTAGSQSYSEMGLNLRFSYLGYRGMLPSADE